MSHDRTSPTGFSQSSSGGLSSGLSSSSGKSGGVGSRDDAFYSDRLTRIDSRGGTDLDSHYSGSGASARSQADVSEEFNAAEREHWSALRKHVFKVIDSKWFGAGILVIIFINTVLIAVQTDRGTEMAAGWYFDVVDNFFLGIYVFELFAKLFVLRGRFRKSGWNVFDAFIVATSFIEYVQFLVASSTTINPKVFRLLRVFRAIRALRALRVLRTISFLDNLQVIVNTLLSSIPAMGNVILLLLLIMYIFSLIGTTLYREAYPSRFGSLFRAFFTMFQILTLDDWFGHYDVLRPIDPFSLLYFIAFIILATFILINLFIAVLVSSLEQSQRQVKAQRRRDDRADRKARRAQRDKQRCVCRGGMGGGAGVDWGEV
jgi:cation channel sperm-associated protein 1